MARAFKDMIVQEADGKPRLTFRNRQGAAVLEDVAVEVSSTVQQQGDAWGALAANLLLELDDDDVPYAIAPEFTPAVTRRHSLRGRNWQQLLVNWPRRCRR